MTKCWYTQLIKCCFCMWSWHVQILSEGSEEALCKSALCSAGLCRTLALPDGNTMPNSLLHTSAPLALYALPDFFLKKSFGYNFYELNKPAQASIPCINHNTISWKEQQSPRLNSLIKHDAMPGATPRSPTVLSLAFPELIHCPLQPTAKRKQGTRIPQVGRVVHNPNSRLSFLCTPLRCTASQEQDISSSHGGCSGEPPVRTYMPNFKHTHLRDGGLQHPWCFTHSSTLPGLSGSWGATGTHPQ